MTTFGELVAVADAHLTQVTEALEQPGAEQELRHPAAVAELSRLVGVLSRYSQQLVAGFGAQPFALLEERKTARQCVELLRQAQEVLGSPSSAGTAPLPIAAGMRSAGVALGCGMDLLTSNSDSSAGLLDKARSQNGKVLSGPVGARALLNQVSRTSATVAKIAERGDARAAAASAALKRVAKETRAWRSAGSKKVADTTLILSPGELVPEAADKLDLILRPNPDLPLEALRVLATITALNCELNYRVMNQLAVRVQQLGHRELEDTLLTAGDDLKDLAFHWTTIAKSWKQLHLPDQARAAPVVHEARELTLRLGRIVHADPHWTPRPGPAALVKPDLLAGTLKDVADLVGFALQSVQSYDAGLKQHLETLTSARVSQSLNVRERATVRPQSLSEYSAMVNTYSDAQRSVVTAARTLDQAATKVTKRAASAAAPLSRVASSDFPHPPAADKEAAIPQVPLRTRQPTEAKRERGGRGSHG